MKKFFNLLTNLTIIAGILIISYPVISQIYYNYQTKQEVKDFDSSAQKLTSEDVTERIIEKIYAEITDEVVVCANYNCPGQIVISGSKIGRAHV